VDIQDCRFVSVTGNTCPKGETYAIAEVENPARIVTTTIAAAGLSIKMIPVRSSLPVPKPAIPKVLEYLRTITVTKPVNLGDILCENILGLGVNVVATRQVGYSPEQVTKSPGV